jgi:hypothetical protein
MMKKITGGASIQLFHWDIQGVFLLCLGLMMLVVGIDKEAGWLTYLMLMLCVSYPLVRWKIWRSDMNWMNTMKEGEMHD